MPLGYQLKDKCRKLFIEKWKKKKVTNFLDNFKKKIINNFLR